MLEVGAENDGNVGAESIGIVGAKNVSPLQEYEVIRRHSHILTPGRYVGAPTAEDDGEPFEEKMARPTAALREQTEQSARLDQIIWANLEDIGYGG